MKEKVNSEAVRNLSALKTLAVAAAVSVTPLVQGATYDIAAGDVTDLTNKLATCRTSSTTLRLAAGDYDLTGIQMEEEGSLYGKTHLVVSGVKIVGMGEKREDVRLIGDGTCRIYRMINDTYARLENLTITNGYAKAIEGAANSGNGGGIYGYPTVTNCVITGCRADGNGGGTYSYTYIIDCDIANNSASTAGGGVFRPNYVINSLVRGNHSGSHGGGIYGDGYGRAVGSDIVDNSAEGAGGAACALNTISNCFISGNVSAQGGAAIYSWGRSSKFAYDCTICSNKTTTSGAAYEYTVVGGKMFANYCGNHGGAAAKCSLTDVEIYDNCANKYGGGVYDSNVTNCTLRGNFYVAGDGSGANAYSSVLYGCDISGTGVNSGRAINCVFHDIVNNIPVSGNPYISDIVWSGHVYSGVPVCTNCLFRNNVLTNYSLSLLCGVNNPTRSGSIVNCTVVSNKWGKTFSYMASEEYPVSVKNCVFVWNQGHDTTNARDFHAWENVSSNGLRFANCAYGSATGLFAAGKASSVADSSDGPMYKFGAGGFPADPGFVLKNTDHPFEPKRTSPLRGLGDSNVWVRVADATDIRGEGFPRLRDGALDIGCYQCWIMPIGTVLSIR